MSNQSTLIGPFAQIYVGNSTDSTALVPITAIRTQGGTIKEVTPGQFLDVIGNEAQADRHKIELTLTFFGDDVLITKIARGLSIAASNADDAPGFTQYTLLCVHVDDSGPHSYLFPVMRTERTFSQNFQKTATSTLQIVFTAENRNRTTQLMYKGNLAYCLTHLAGGRSPF